MSAHLELSFDLGTLDPHAAEAACLECGAGAVTFAAAQEEAVLEPLPGEVRLWQRTKVQALFLPEQEPLGCLLRLSAALRLQAQCITVRALPERIWEHEWLKDCHATRFGSRLWVCPSHERVHDPQAVVVHLDPGLAFGTGTHASTALCLRWLDEGLPPGQVLIDYGCGCGLLGIAAAKLGARRVHAYDIDPQAQLATRQNADANGLGARLHVHEQAHTLPQGAGVLLANILAGTLCELMPEFARLLVPAGLVVLSGILEAQLPDVTGAYAPCFDVTRFGARDGWVCLVGRRRGD